MTKFPADRRLPTADCRLLRPYNRAVPQFLLITTLLTIAGLLTSITLGFLASPVHAAQHILTALITTLIGLFSQSMTMFFFIGSGKQIKEKAKGAPDEAAVVQRTKEFKSRVFPAAMYAILVLMVTFITGGGVAAGKTPVWMHLILAFTTLVMFGRAYYVEIRAMTDNARLIEKVF